MMLYLILIIILNKVINLGYVVFRFSYFVERENNTLEESFNLEVIKKLSENTFFKLLAICISWSNIP